MTSSVKIHRGSEGPRHDPYSYEEVTVTRPDGRVVVMHTGLSCWLGVTTAEGRKIYVEEGLQNGHSLSGGKLLELFEFHAGISLFEAQKVPMKREQSRWRTHSRECGHKDIRETTGYPGESMDYCTKCGFVGNYHFDRSAIE